MIFFNSNVYFFFYKKKEFLFFNPIKNNFLPCMDPELERFANYERKETNRTGTTPTENNSFFIIKKDFFFKKDLF